MKVLNWETAKYGKIWYDEDVLDPRSVETEFPAIVFNDSLTSNETPSCEPADLAERMRMVDIGDDRPELGAARCSMTWRQIILALGLHIAEEMAEDGFGAYWLGSERVIPDKGDLSNYWVEISSGRDFLRGAPSHTYIREPVRRLCHSMDQGEANVSYLLAQYLFRHAEGRKSGDRLCGGQFIWHLAHHFGLVSDDGLRKLSIVARELSLIDMGELVKLNICMEIRDDWAWVASGPERQQLTVANAPKAAEDAPIDYAQRMGRLEEEIQGLRKDVRSLRGLVESLMTDQDRVSTWMISCMTQLIEASGQTYQAFDGTF
ncbi:hypothetical protein Tco_0469403 [Tanacetum coccineum]